METIIIKPINEILKKYVQYFLFLRKSDSNLINYTTFPNSNLCLAIYRQNSVNYTSDISINRCNIEPGSKSFTSRIYGFHAMPFNVSIDTDLDQICIVFHPASLRAFTDEKYSEMHGNNAAFEQIFGTSTLHSLEMIFGQTDPKLRARELERILLNKLHSEVPTKLREALHYINLANIVNCELTIGTLCKKLDISDTTLFRLFKNHVGQNAQKFLKTVRFRNVLAEVLKQDKPFTELGYRNHYYDQAHFIRDFKAFTGHPPKGLVSQISVQQKDLTWIYKEIDGE